MLVLMGIVGLIGCTPGDGILFEEEETLAAGTDWTTDAWADPTPATVTSETTDPKWDGASIRIISPDPADIVQLNNDQIYVAELVDAEGEPLALGDAELAWFSSVDLDFWGDTLQFTSNSLAIGDHELTVVADLPNGDRIAHSIGGVRVQSEYAGTYSGLFSVDGEVQGFVITCTGVGSVNFGLLGSLGVGDGDCLVSLLGIDVPLTWVFDLENDGTGVIGGTAGVDLAGFFTYNFPAEGSLDPEGAGLTLSVDGTIPFVGPLSAFLNAPRTSLD